jgi:hypothetical protein
VSNINFKKKCNQSLNSSLPLFPPLPGVQGVGREWADSGKGVDRGWRGGWADCGQRVGRGWQRVGRGWQRVGRGWAEGGQIVGMRVGRGWAEGGWAKDVHRVGGQ